MSKEIADSCDKLIKYLEKAIKELPDTLFEIPEPSLCELEDMLNGIGYEEAD